MLGCFGIQSIPNIFNGWHVRWVYWPCKNWDVCSFQELCTDPYNMGLCIIMLQHEVMVVDEWHNNRPQDLITVSLCIQNAINKIYLSSLSITYACPYHNPTATMGHSIHNIDISKPRAVVLESDLGDTRGIFLSSRTWSLDSPNVLVGLDRVQQYMLFFFSFKTKPLIWLACSANG